MFKIKARRTRYEQRRQPPTQLNKINALLESNSKCQLNMQPYVFVVLACFFFISFSKSRSAVIQKHTIERKQKFIYTVSYESGIRAPLNVNSEHFIFVKYKTMCRPIICLFTMLHSGVVSLCSHLTIRIVCV